jgi:23S rRNA pseudouridine955/2504/2580 synthase
LHLHARRLRIDHPAGGKIDVTAPLPDHFAESLAALGFNELAGDALANIADFVPPDPDAKKRAQARDARRARKGERRARGAAAPARPTGGKRPARPGNPTKRPGGDKPRSR